MTNIASTSDENYAKERLSSGIILIKMKTTKTRNNGQDYLYMDEVYDVFDENHVQLPVYIVKYHCQNQQRKVQKYVKKGALFVVHNDSSSYHDVMGVVVYTTAELEGGWYHLIVRKLCEPLRIESADEYDTRSNGKPLQRGFQCMWRDIFGVKKEHIIKDQTAIQHMELESIGCRHNLDIIKNTIILYRQERRSMPQYRMYEEQCTHIFDIQTP